MNLTITPQSIEAAVRALEDEMLSSLMLTEGIYDPGILKAVFMAGGPGSGKSTAASALFDIDAKKKQTWSEFGLKTVSSDIAFEYMLKKHGIVPSTLAQIERENPELYDSITSTSRPDSLRNIAKKKITDKQRAFYFEGKLGMIVDGTGENFDKIRKQRDDAIKNGYDTFMVFVYTDLATALARNHKRGKEGGRQLADDLVRDFWEKCVNNIERMRALFGPKNFAVVDRNDGAPTIDHDAPSVNRKGVEHFIPGRAGSLRQAINNFLRQPIQNPIGREWLQIASAYEHLRGR